MTKPSDFSPAQALEVKDSGDLKQSRRTRWGLRIVGASVLLFGWLAVGLHEVEWLWFLVDTIVFVAMALYAFGAAAVSRINAVNEERRLRLRLLVHNMELENLSMRDELTQLFNRRYLFERLERELHTAKGFQRPLAFIALEFTPLKSINHTYGYAAGDRLLAAFGQLLLEGTRATDIPGRMSGNKFGIILPDTSKRGAFTMVSRLTESLAATPLTGDGELTSAEAVSVGVSGYPWSGEEADVIVRQAEAEMAGESGIRGETGPGADVMPAEDVPAIFRALDEAPKGS